MAEAIGTGQFKHALCRGAFALGTACGHCERCAIDPLNPANGAARDAERVEKAFAESTSTGAPSAPAELFVVHDRNGCLVNAFRRAADAFDLIASYRNDYATTEEGPFTIDRYTLARASSGSGESSGYSYPQEWVPPADDAVRIAAARVIHRIGEWRPDMLDAAFAEPDVPLTDLGSVLRSLRIAAGVHRDAKGYPAVDFASRAGSGERPEPSRLDSEDEERLRDLAMSERSSWGECGSILAALDICAAPASPHSGASGTPADAETAADAAWDQRLAETQPQLDILAAEARISVSPASGDAPTCTVCRLDAEGRDARCSACPCLERADVRRDAERTHRVLADATATLQLGIDGTIDRERAYTDAFVAMFTHLYGPSEALRIVAEGRRADV